MNSKDPSWKLDISSKIQEIFSKDADRYIKLLEAGSYNHRKFTWIFSGNRNLKSPQSGWKIHISASLYNAEEVLDSVLPILATFPFSFKATGNLDFLAFLNNNPLGAEQAGKFITVYIHDNSKAFDLANKLHKATVKFKSPKVVTDLQFSKNSNIYYRYGALSAKYDQSLWGSLLSVMNVNGKKVFDFKNPDENFYDQIDNPFSKSFPKKVEKIETSTNINDFYLNEKILKCYRLESAGSSETLLCLDLPNKRRCIVKVADKNTSTDILGNDAIQRLQYEEAILKKLNNKNISPKFYDSFNDERERYCISMEDLPGDNLHNILKKHLISQKKIPITKLLTWAKKIAFIVHTLHELYIIHADLKLSNIILLDSGELKIIDFDASCDLSTGNLIYSCGSVGYCTKNRERGLKPVINDDIYSFGAMLYYLFCHVDPDASPLEIEQTEIKPEFHNPNLPINIQQLIKECLNGTFKNLSEIINFLELAQSNKIQINLPNTLNQYKEKLKFLTDAYIAKGYDENTSTFNFSQILIEGLEITDLRGVAGSIIGIALSALANGSNEQVTFSLQRNVLRLLNEKLPYNKIPGLYVGESGKALALLYASKVLKDDSLSIHAQQFMKNVNELPLLSVDLFNGVAGTIRVNLIFWLLSNDKDFLDSAQSMINYLITSKQYRNGYITWYNPSESSTPDDFQLNNTESFLGYAHGIAGIADALLDYYLITNDEKIKSILDEVIKCLMDQSISTLAGEGLVWSDKLNDKAVLSFWCHGGAGIGLFLSRAMHYKIITSSKELISKILKPIILFTRGSAPIICHGTLGSLESLMDIYKFMPELHDSSVINIFENIVSCWIRTYINNGLTSSNMHFAFFGYLTGVAGIISVYARLANSAIPNPLQLEFAYYLQKN